ncbi:MAG: hypothetical protein IPO67_27170 [Deltaproteobacteria bacterium]|nr:hypothetical protein [Deltaproteobacteria bacterium]
MRLRRLLFALLPLLVLIVGAELVARRLEPRAGPTPMMVPHPTRIWGSRRGSTAWRASPSRWTPTGCGWCRRPPRCAGCSPWGLVDLWPRLAQRGHPYTRERSARSPPAA